MRVFEFCTKLCWEVGSRIIALPVYFIMYLPGILAVCGIALTIFLAFHVRIHWV